jgi:hypothetical protein
MTARMIRPRLFVSTSLLRLVVCPVVIGAPLCAEVIVNPPQAITHRVEVQPIRVRKSTGQTAATLGSTVVESYIKTQINRVWAQMGVRIDWLLFNDYTNDFAYDGSPGNYDTMPRPQSHLDTIVDSAGVPPKSPNAKVLNLFFVEIVPGFDRLDDSSMNGLAFVDANGVAVHVGAELLTYTTGRDIVASVIAHEIGHNLGLDHVGSADNLMNSNGNAERLTASQKSIVFSDETGFDGFDLLQPITANYSQWAAANGVSGGPDGDEDRDGIKNVIV